MNSRNSYAYTKHLWSSKRIFFFSFRFYFQSNYNGLIIFTPVYPSVHYYFRVVENGFLTRIFIFHTHTHKKRRGRRKKIMSLYTFLHLFFCSILSVNINHFVCVCTQYYTVYMYGHKYTYLVLFFVCLYVSSDLSQGDVLKNVRREVLNISHSFGWKIRRVKIAQVNNNI